MAKTGGIESARGWRFAGVVLLVAVLAGCATPIATTAPATASSTPAPTPTAAAQATASPAVVSGPIGLAVIGHSGATGYNSDPDQPGIDIRANSWATGTNPAVDSIYLRLLAQDSTIEGHATNLAVDGSDVSTLLVKANELVTRQPAPSLILIQTIDNDMKCDGTDEANIPAYGANLAGVLKTLREGLRDTKVFIVSQWASVEVYSKVVFAIDPMHLTGDGPCDVVDPTSGKLVPAKEASFQKLVDAYWAVVVADCAKSTGCRTDGGALQKMDLAAADLTSDLNHLSAAGHAKVAGLVWAALTSGT